jgi:molecular chaperone GrpE
MSEETEQEMPEARIADPANDSAPDALAVLKAEVESLRDQRLRALAEAENIRRRAERDKAEASQYAVTKFARDMVSIADNFSRALAACPPELREAADPQVKAVLDGVEATDRQLMATLERYGVKPVPTEGKFDPNLHQAIAEVPGNGKPAGVIVDVVQAGYTIGDRLLRPAMVTVARRDDAAAPVDTKV